MYNISKLSNESKNFLQNLPLTSKSNQEVILTALAKVISSELTLPSTPVENVSSFYLQTIYSNVRDTISFMNEMVIVDVNRLQELVKVFWLVRYNLLYPRKKLFVVNTIVTEAHFFGFSSLLSVEMTNFIQTNTPVLIEVANGFSKIVSELNETESD